MMDPVDLSTNESPAIPATADSAYPGPLELVDVSWEETPVEIHIVEFFLRTPQIKIHQLFTTL